MTDISAPRFEPHGRSIFERRGQILLLQSEGPFNAEHIQSLAPEFARLGAELMRDGPWVTLNLISRSILGTPEALEMMKKSAVWTRDALGRIGSGFVVAAGVEGRTLMRAPLLACYEGVMAAGIFDDYATAEAWAQELLAKHATGRK